MTHRRLKAGPRPAVAPLALALGLLAACQPAAGPEGAAVAAAPGQIVQLPDGRKMNLRCQGRGSPTVLFESGFGADSGAWFKVQPQIAQTTRACAYDRAGYGFSDPGPLPRDGQAIARDLDQLLTEAHLEGPFVLVGHSAGGLYMRLFAARRGADVQGMVLLDPTIEQHAVDPAADGLEGIRRRVQRCLAASQAQPQPPLDDARWQGCLPARRTDNAIAVAQRPDSWRNELSELDAIYGRTSDQVAMTGGVLRTIPIYVLTASDTAAAAPKLGYANQSLWELGHMRLAFSSEHGSQRTVLSSHLMMLDRPDAVVAAVTAMVEAARAGRAPPALPASEQPGEASEFGKAPATDPPALPK